MDSILSQIRAAMAAGSWTIDKLLHASGIDLDQSTMSRKLNGKTPMTVAEMELIVNALGITVACVPSRVA